jgi:hypothetical protein
MAKQNRGKKNQQQQKKMYKPKELNGKKTKKRVLLRLNHELVGQHVQKNHIY